MACIHYRFSFQTNYKFIPLNGLPMTVRDLKGQIMKKEHLKPLKCDLKISNDQDEEYTDETTQLEKYSCVIVRRIPARVLVHNPQASKEDRIRAEILQSSHWYQTKEGSQKHPGSAPPHRLCHHCGQPGHYIQKCPLRLNAPGKVRTCNANSLLVRAETGDDGATLTSTGRCVNSADKGWDKQENKDPVVPTELKCVICKLLMVDAAIVPCCGYSFCDTCIRTVLLESEEHICVSCQETVSPDSIVPNLALRRAVTNYKSIIGSTKGGRTGPNGRRTRVPLTRRSAPYSYRPSRSRPCQR